MKIFVKAKPRARETDILRLDDTHFEISVTEPPIHGKANQAIIKALAEYFGVETYRVNILSGHTARQKIIEISD